jgi:hypothetical protein
MLTKASYLPEHSHGWEKYLFGSFLECTDQNIAALGGRENLIFENRPNFLILQKPFSKASGIKKPF